MILSGFKVSLGILYRKCSKVMTSKASELVELILQNNGEKETGGDENLFEIGYFGGLPKWFATT